MKKFHVISDGKMALRLFWLCWLVYFISYLGRLNYSSAMTVMLQKSIITKTEGGFISMLYFFAYGCGQLCNGLLGDKLHPGRMITGGLIISGVINILMTYCHSFFIMSLLWCLNGYAQSMLWPPIIKIFSEMLDEKRKVHYCIDIVSTQALGTLASYLLSAAIIGWGRWEFVFLAAGILILMVAVIWRLGFKKIELYTDCYGTKSIEEKRSKEKNDEKNKCSFMPLIMSSGMLVIIFPVVVHGMLKDGVTSWVPTYISEIFLIPASFSIAVTIVLPIVNLSGAYMARFVYTRIRKQEIKSAGIFFTVATAALILLLAVGKESLMLTVVLFAIITASMMAINTLFVNLYPLRFQFEGRVAAVSGFLNAMAYIGTAISTVTIGILVQMAGWSVTIFSWIVVTLMALLICMVAARKEKNRE